MQPLRPRFLPRDSRVWPWSQLQTIKIKRTQDVLFLFCVFYKKNIYIYILQVKHTAWRTFICLISYMLCVNIRFFVVFFQNKSLILWNGFYFFILQNLNTENTVETKINHNKVNKITETKCHVIHSYRYVKMHKLLVLFFEEKIVFMSCLFSFSNIKKVKKL